jgi:hypothetical protein
MIGLQFAKNSLFLNFIAESDSTNTINAVADQQHIHSYMGHIVADCFDLFPSFHSLQISHIRRVAN